MQCREQQDERQESKTNVFNEVMIGEGVLGPAQSEKLGSSRTTAAYSNKRREAMVVESLSMRILERNEASTERLGGSLE